MLYWKADFQIPNSGTQALEVYAVATIEDNSVMVNFYAEQQQINLLFSKEYSFDRTFSEPYEFLKSLEEFAEYTVL